MNTAILRINSLVLDCCWPLSLQHNHKKYGTLGDTDKLRIRPELAAAGGLFVAVTKSSNLPIMEEPTGPQPSVSPAQVAMLCQGTEVYGIGTIIKLYAIAWPEMSFVALSDGALVDWLRGHGNRVDVVPGLATFWEGGPSLWTLSKMPSVLTRARRDAARIDTLLRPRGIRIVHSHWRPQQIIGGFMRPRGYKSVWQINNNMNSRRLWGAGKWLSHRLAKWGADLLLPASDYIGANWTGCGVPMRTIRNAATPKFPAPNHLPAPPVRAIIAGRLVHEKGHHLAVEAVIRARRAGANVQLDVYGDPLTNNPYADELRARVTAARCGDAIRFLGFHPEMRDLHQQYHLGLQCRVNPEPCSLWVCETLVDGLPLVASASGGTPELVADGETGLLCRPDDVDDLADKLLQIVSDLPRLDQMRSRAFERGQRLFTLQRFTQETLAAYESLSC
jgi:glycosyltransferase involved in cell wall biosynthesis